jgi:hypothetical protein
VKNFPEVQEMRHRDCPGGAVLTAFQPRVVQLGFRATF